MYCCCQGQLAPLCLTQGESGPGKYQNKRSFVMRMLKTDKTARRVYRSIVLLLLLLLHSML